MSHTATSGPRIDKIDQTSLRETVYGALRDAFTRGEFAPGATVNLRGLADQLGTSMTPVREAVRRLVAEGALLDMPRRALMVPGFDAARMQDLKSARLALEALVLERAMDRMEPATLDAMAAILAAPGGSGPDLVRNYEFHFALYRQSQSEVLLRLVEGLWVQYGAYLHLIVRQPAAARIEEHRHHRDLLDALRRNDRPGAQAALTADIERSFRLLTGGAPA